MINTLKQDKRGHLKHSPLFVALCAKARANVSEISAAALQQKVDQERPFYLIDVRDKEEVDQQGYIPGAYHISKGWIEADIHYLVDDPNADIVLYCGGGNRSLLAAESLTHMGYTQVKSLAGGFKGYARCT